MDDRSTMDWRVTADDSATTDEKAAMDERATANELCSCHRSDQIGTILTIIRPRKRPTIQIGSAGCTVRSVRTSLAIP
jgi:hypothetical protein